MATQSRLPTGDGSEYTAWLASGAGTVPEAVDDAVGAADDDTTYGYRSASASHFFEYTNFDISSTAIAKITVTMRCRETGNSYSVAGRLHVNGVTFTGTYQALTTSYADYTEDWLTNPNTAAAWVEADVEGVGASPLQDFGARLREDYAHVDEGRCTQIYITVDYTEPSSSSLSSSSSSLSSSSSSLSSSSLSSSSSSLSSSSLSSSSSSLSSSSSQSISSSSSSLSSSSSSSSLSSSSSSLSSSSESSSSLSSSSSSESTSSESSSSSATPGTVYWGHDTGVEETFTRDFTGNWSGTGTIAGAGDAEKITLNAGESEDSETWYIGTGKVKIELNKYQAGSGPTPTIKYKMGPTKSVCENAAWNTYTGPFTSLGWVKIRVER